MNLSKLNSENYVAKYTTFDRVIKDILPFNKIRVSSANKVNDPYENKKGSIIEADIFFSQDSTGKEYFEFKEKFEDAQYKLLSHIKLFCTSIYSLEKVNYINHAHEIYAKPRMWATYGDNHKGVCLVFNKKELTHQFEKVENFKISENKMNYDKLIIDAQGRNPLLSNNDLNKIYKDNLFDIEKLFKVLDSNDTLTKRYFRKHYDWNSENEYRWLIFSKTSEDLDVDYGNSLKAIFLGIDFNEKYQKLLKKYVNDIPVYKISFNNGKYEAEKL